jgi:hypothetical protein
MLNKGFPKIVPFMTCGKIQHSHIGHRWQYTTAHAHCVLGNYGWLQITQSEYATQCVSTATRVMRTRRNVTFILHCPSCWMLNFVVRTVTIVFKTLNLLPIRRSICWDINHKLQKQKASVTVYSKGSHGGQLTRVGLLLGKRCGELKALRRKRAAMSQNVTHSLVLGQIP